MKSATESPRRQVTAWLIWVMVVLVILCAPQEAEGVSGPATPLLTGIILHDRRFGRLLAWTYCVRMHIWRWCRELAQAINRLVYRICLAKLAVGGAITLARVVDGLTRSQMCRQLGALPVLYDLLDVLGVRKIINQHCPTAADVDHGTVALVLILNRLTAPRPLYRIADWVARTVLVHRLGVPAAKFNDDRLGRTLDALSEQTRDIWQDVVHQALLVADIDLTVIFYDLTAFVVHGAYAASELIDFGFAHNTPMGKQKLKTGVDATADGDLPLDYALWSGRTADLATVEENMARLCRLLRRNGRSPQETMIIGDRANLNDALALAYDDHDLRYLAGLQPHKRQQRELLTRFPERQLHRHPLSDKRGREGYWGRLCQVTFQHEDRQVTHRGLVVLSGPMRSALRKTRAAKLRALRQELKEVRTRIGKPYYRTVEAVQQRADTRIKRSGVAPLVYARASLDAQGQIDLHWQIDRQPLLAAMRRDGRYLLVTNDWSLTAERMLALYRDKDGVEKRFRVAKSDLKVSPIYLHKDARIESMLLINMLALLAYSLLERQVRQRGWQITTRKIIETLETISVVETHCWDGSLLVRITPRDPDQAALLEILIQVLVDLRGPGRLQPLLTTDPIARLTWSSPDGWQDRLPSQGCLASP